jgi:phosphatidylglycerol lysyltransferase
VGTPSLPPALQSPFFRSVFPLGVVFVFCVAGYLLFCALRTLPVKIRAWEFPFPPLRLAITQVLLSSVDWALVAGVLYVLLPVVADLSYPFFLGFFILAQIVGVSSQVPGGLGVFETIMVLLLSPQLPTPAIIGALVVYRAIYYLLPLGVAAILLALHELVRKKEVLSTVAGVVGHWAPVLIPHVLALSTFAAGTLLLISGATPAVPTLILARK